MKNPGNDPDQLTRPVYYWHVHHELLAEQRRYPISERINYIKTMKSLDEQPLRLALLRRVKNQKAVREAIKKYEALDVGYSTPPRAASLAKKTLVAEITKLHAEECEKDCPWHTTQRQDAFYNLVEGTIFSRGWKQHRLAKAKAGK